MEELLSKDENGNLKKWLIEVIMEIHNVEKLEKIFYFLKGMKNKDSR